MNFSAQQKLEIVLEGMNNDITIKDLCDKHNISRQTYYDWKDNLKEGALKSLDSQKAGRKSKNHLSSIEEAQEKLNKLEQEKQELEDKLHQTKKESAIYQLQRDYIKFSLTEDDIDPVIKARNKELLKKTIFR